MLYYLFRYLEREYQLPGAGLFEFLTFRAALAVLLSLLISIVYGRRIIEHLQRLQIGEVVRNLGLEGQMQKQGTPTMGGVIIVLAVLVPTLLVARLGNFYILLLLISTIWLGTIGFMDDYIKVFRKDKKGLAGRFKVVGQIGLGLIVGSALYFNDAVVIRERMSAEKYYEFYQRDPNARVVGVEQQDAKTWYQVEHPSMKTTIPFFKGNELDYADAFRWLGEKATRYTFLLYIPVVIFIITAVSNGANLTDGLDGLASGTSAVIVFTLAAFAYLSGNAIFSGYLNIMYIPNLGELTIFTAALVGACVGFLWYNAFPAQVFMGDTGSLTLGGLIAVLAIMMRKELLIPLLCGIFLLENLSVVLQVSYFRYTRRKFGEGRRIFLMSPLHHHYQKKGFPEPKIVTRFWVAGIFLAILSIITLKLR
jgi:phospho-N-acetylmuramoyl-pentapeptide-transferase